MTQWLVAALLVAMVAGSRARAEGPTNATEAAKGPAPDAAPAGDVLIRTSMGDIPVRLFADKAPATVANFLRYVDEGFYAGTIFHRVIDGFMIQGGGFTKQFQQKPTHEPVRNEAGNGVKNRRGTLAMARTMDVNSATAQFFINVADNAFLDFKAPTDRGFGYCVFAEVVGGMDVVDKIKGVKTATMGPHENVPVEPVEILEIRRTAAAPKAP